MPGQDVDRLWEYGGYWIRRAHGSLKLYACWYDPRGRRTHRRSLGTEVLDEAKDRLIALAGAAETDGSRSPERVMIMAALDHYYEHDVRAKPSGYQAKRAIAIVAEFLNEKIGPAAKVASFGPIRQREFMEWSPWSKHRQGGYCAARRIQRIGQHSLRRNSRSRMPAGLPRTPLPAGSARRQASQPPLQCSPRSRSQRPLRPSRSGRHTTRKKSPMCTWISHPITRISKAPRLSPAASGILMRS
jgi:hypothetical protein